MVLRKNRGRPSTEEVVERISKQLDQALSQIPKDLKTFRVPIVAINSEKVRNKLCRHYQVRQWTTMRYLVEGEDAFFEFFRN